jgi:hypothetical protein
MKYQKIAIVSAKNEIILLLEVRLTYSYTHVQQKNLRRTPNNAKIRRLMVVHANK